VKAWKYQSLKRRGTEGNIYHRKEKVDGNNANESTSSSVAKNKATKNPWKNRGQEGGDASKPLYPEKKKRKKT